MTRAEQIANRFPAFSHTRPGSDETIGEACEAAGARTDLYAGTGPQVRYVFEDGSAIIDADAGWQVRHPRCKCGWCGTGDDLCAEVSR